MGLRLVDHHCHGVLGEEPSDEVFASYLTESDRVPAAGTSSWDSSLGLAVRRWCPPVLGLEPWAAPQEYLARRRELGAAEANSRLLRASGLAELLVDTGLDGPGLLTPAELAALTGARAREVVRLESVAQRLEGTTAERWARDVTEALAGSGALAFKSVAAYRCGLDLPGERPSPAEIANAAGAYLGAGRGRLTHPVLIRHLLWTALELGRPLQLHTGFGDPDVTLHRADPSLLTPFLRAVEPLGAPVVLLHGWPYHRQAAWLAQAFPHVHADLGLTLGHVGPAAPRVLGEALELAPFGKLLFSTDAYGLAELYLVGARNFREALHDWAGAARLPQAEADRIARLIGADNARRVYGLGSDGLGSDGLDPAT